MGMTATRLKNAANSSAWALGQQQRNGFHVRRIVWGLFMAKAECREQEEIRAATILVEGAPKTKAAKAKAAQRKRALFPSDPQLALRRNDLKYFDLLPEKLRRVVNETDVKCRSDVIYRMWKLEGMTCAQIVKQLKSERP
jgi:hypothetical protein